MMMDELDLLKKDWQSKEEYLPKLSFDEIYKMIWKKSSSIVKWIFYISIIEFLFWIILSNIPTKSDSQLDAAKYTNTIAMFFEYLGYGITLFFIIKFYLNYKKISSVDSTRKLMKNILKVRKTVMTYVWLSICLFAVSLITLIVELLFFEPEFTSFADKVANAENPWMVYFVLFIGVVFTILIIGTLLWLFYKLVYGILLKRLNVNYRELKKLEI